MIETPTVTKAILQATIVEKLGLTAREALDIVEAVLESISKRLEQGETVRLSGFGNFSVRNKAARPGRNPRTGEDKEICARKVVTFRMGNKLNERISLLTQPAKDIS